MTTLEKEDGDESGTFTLGVAITENRDDVETKMVYLSSSSLFVDSINQAVSGTNMELMSSVLSWMCGQESSVSIPSKKYAGFLSHIDVCQRGILEHGIYGPATCTVSAD